MILFIEDFAGDRMKIDATDKCEAVGFTTYIGNSQQTVDATVKQVDEIIHVLTQWRNLQS